VFGGCDGRGAAGELDEGVERVRLARFLAALGPRLLEHLVHEWPVRGAERGARLDGPTGDYIPGALGIGERAIASAFAPDNFPERRASSVDG